MLSKFLTTLRRLSRRLWVRILLVAGLSVVALPLALVFGPFLPDGLGDTVGSSALDRLLDMLATSMLTVTIFSLTVMVSVHRASSQQFTPRVHRTILKDTTTQSALATFVGAWIYALAAIVLSSSIIVDEGARVPLYLMTLFVLLLVLLAMVRWILHLQTLGSLLDTAGRMETDATKAVDERRLAPCYDAHPFTLDDMPEGLVPIPSDRTGYVQAIYVERLQQAAEAARASLWLTAPPGRFVHEGQPIAWTDRRDDRLEARVLREGIHMGVVRTTEQDPRFGLIQMAELALKALSPSVNDPGTAIEMIGRIVRVLRAYGEEKPSKLRYDRLHALPLDPADLVADAFAAIARDGKPFVEVQVALEDALNGLADYGPPALAPTARVMAQRARRRAEEASEDEEERLRLARGTVTG